MLYSAYILSGLYKELPHIIGIAYPLPFLYGPLWYLYAKILTGEQKRLSAKDYLHSLPFLFGVIILLPYYFYSGEWKIELIQNLSERLPRILAFGNLVMVVQGFVYMILTVAILKKHLSHLKNFFSEIENVSLRWLRNISVIIAGIWFAVACVHVLKIFNVSPLQTLDPVVAVGISIFIFSAGYLGLKQKEIFDSEFESFMQKENVVTAFPPNNEASETGYRKSGLNEIRKEEIKNQLLEYFEKEKPYLNSELTLKELSEGLSVSEHNLSEVINTSLNQNYFDLINSYRVKEVQQRMKNPENKNFTILAIAFDSGFNSKSSFNSVFKKITGMTPTEFKRLIFFLI